MMKKQQTTNKAINRLLNAKLKIACIFLLACYIIPGKAWADEPVINVFKKIPSGYTGNLKGSTIPVLAGSTVNLQVVIAEPESDYTFFGSSGGELNLAVSSGIHFVSTGDVSFVEVVPGNISLVTLTCLSNLIKQTVTVDNATPRKDQITISNLKIRMPLGMNVGDSYTLSLDAFFTTGAVSLLTFTYEEPQITVSPANGKACMTNNVYCTVKATPNDLPYTFFVNNSNKSSFTDSTHIWLKKGDIVYVRDLNNTDVTNYESNRVTIDDTFFELITLSNAGAKKCLGDSVRYHVSFDEESCIAGAEFKAYIKNNDVTHEIRSLDSHVASFDFRYAPDGLGSVFIIASNNGNTLYSNEIDITESVYCYQKYQLDQNIRLDQKQIEIDLLKKIKKDDTVSVNYDYNGINELTINGIYSSSGQELEYLTNGTVENNSAYTFGRFRLNYNMDNTGTDSIFDPKAKGVTTGDTKKNRVSFYYGKHFEDNKVCFDSTITEINVIGSMVQVPQESFCSPDSTYYTIKINDNPVNDYYMGDDYCTIMEYKGFKVKVGGRLYKEVNMLNTYVFSPSELWDLKDITNIEIEALVNIYIKDRVTDIPLQWRIRYEDKVGYTPGSWVRYNNKLYECKKETYPSCLPTNTEYWRVLCDDCCDDPDCGIFCHICTFTDEWTPYPRARVQYGRGSRVSYNGKIYESNRYTYSDDIPGFSDAWEYMEDITFSGSPLTSVQTYATGSFYIYKPKSDGRFINLDDSLGISNQPIDLASNYTIKNIRAYRVSATDTILNDTVIDDSEKTDGIWRFTPEVLVSMEEDSARALFQLVYEDYNGCTDSSLIPVYVAENNVKKPPLKASNLLSKYCAENRDIEINANLKIDKILGPGVYSPDGDTTFIINPKRAIDSNEVAYNKDTSLTVYFRDGAGNRFKNIYPSVIRPQPVVGFSYSDLCLGDYTLFKDTSVFVGDKNNITRFWDFNDVAVLKLTGHDTTDIAANTHAGRTTGQYGSPAHRYDNAGVYRVNLTVESKYNCTDEYTDTVIIGDYPMVNFTPLGFIHGMETKLTNHSTAETFDPVDSSYWKFDDPFVNDSLKTFSTRDTSYIFNDNGVHNVKLTVYTVNGCASDTTIKVPVFAYITVNNDNLYQARFDRSEDDFLASHTYNNKPSGWKLQKAVKPYTHRLITGNIWLTATPDRMIPNERSWVESPCFNIDSLDFPMLSLDIYQSVEKGRDGAVLEYTLDDGETWYLLTGGSSEIDRGMNWYNQKGIVSHPGSSENTTSAGWSENIQEWQTARFPLDELKSEAIESSAECVRFRVSYAGDAGTAEGEDIKGFGFDNFLVTERSRVVLIEQFVNSVYDKELMISESAWLNKFMETRGKEAVDIRYHNQMAQYYSDPLFEIDPPDIGARSAEYGANAWLQTRVDGIFQAKSEVEGGAGKETAAFYNLRTLTDKRFDIDVQTENKDGKLHIKATVTKLADTLIFPSEATDRNCLVRMAIVQDTFIYKNEQFLDVLVEMLPNGVGNNSGFIPKEAKKGDVFTFEDYWEPNVTTIDNSFTLIVYVQNKWGLDEVQQTWFKQLDVSEIPQVKRWPLKIEETKQQIFGVYPVPVKETMVIHSNHTFNSPVQWKLSDISGQIMKEGQISKGETRQTVNTTGLTTGTYIIVFENRENSVVERQKILIIH